MTKERCIVIVGSGAYGLSSAYHLAEEGYTNIKVFDRGSYESNNFSPLQGADGASTDLNKLVRASYVDKIHYQHLATESIEKYYEWNKQFLKMSFLPTALSEIQSRCLEEGDLQPLFQNTGYIRLDDYENGEETRNLLNFEKIGLRSHSYDINDPVDIARSKTTGWFDKLDPLNQRKTVQSLTGVLDSFAGVALADKCLLWLKYLCERTGNVNFYFGSEVGAVEEIVFSSSDSNDAVGVKTKDGIVHDADQIVIAAGGWCPSLLPQHLSPRLEAVASSYIMIQIPKDRQDLINKYRTIPMINWRMTYESNCRKDAVYMFPATRDGILKIGVNDHHWRSLKKLDDQDTPISIPRTDLKVLPRESVLDYRKFVKDFLPDIHHSGATMEKTKMCFSAVGQKNELVIDFVPGLKNLLVCSGGGFHGFKFLPLIGRFTEGLISGVEYRYHDHFRFKAVNESEYQPVVSDIGHKYDLTSVEYPISRSESSHL